MSKNARARTIRLNRRTILAPIPGLRSGMKSEGRKRVIGQPGDTLELVEAVRVGNVVWYRARIGEAEGYVIGAALAGQAHG